MDLRTQLNEKAQAGAGRVLRIEMPVRWGDLDKLNHVNNTVYFRYMEEARMNFAAACGMGVEGSNRDFVLASVSCDFLRPIFWPATVLVDLRLIKVGNTSVEFETEISVKGEDACCARARNIIVGVDADTGRPSPWRQTELEQFARVLFPAAA